MTRYALNEGELPLQLRTALALLEQEDPQFGFDWLHNLALHGLAPGEKAFIYCACDIAGSLAALPVRLTDQSRLHALATFYTTSYAPVLQGPAAGDLLTEILQTLRQVTPEITVSPMDPNRSEFKVLQHSLTESGWRGIHTFHCFGNWRHQLAGENYTDYLAQRPSRVRNTVSRRTRRFTREGGLLQLIQTDDCLEQATASFTEIYNDSWKQPEPYPAFIPALLKLAAKRGWLRLGLATHNGKAIAAQVWLVAGGTAYIYKLAYREGFEAYSPGTVLTAFLMEQVIDRDGVVALDYLSGDDAYKKDWMTERSERSGIAAFNPASPRGAWLVARQLLKRLLR